MKGRKPKPTEQRRREGNAGKRKLPDPVRIKPGAPKRPDDLPDAGAELWDELVTALTAAGIAEQVDAAALTALCVQWARAEKAREVIAEKGLFARGSTGQLVTHPAVAIEREAHAMLLRFAEHYGLTAAARARIALGHGGASGSGDPGAEGELAQVLDLKPRRVD